MWYLVFATDGEKNCEHSCFFTESSDYILHAVPLFLFYFKSFVGTLFTVLDSTMVNTSSCQGCGPECLQLVS
ncbi:hypothetical protein CDAR_44001 [Caerostris darwini]|uniref:Uncharacterized protein n=1 Tax=Caerostris darwini TaxID=1538125 RepID=A0AAV4WIE6_9ARAC|nr:hypothetical protein CDAR_44001 [Caerostris darwini]